MPLQRLFASGGIVMYPLLGFSLLAIALILERIIFWVRIQNRQTKVVREVLQLYNQNNLAGVFSRLEENIDLPIARIFLAALSRNRPTPEAFRLALESAAQAELPLLRRFNTIFDTIVGLAPLLGLLGTILGLINSFASLRIGEVAGSSATGVTAGISEALVSTASGLIVAIFTLLFSNTFRGLYRRQFALIQEYGGQLELIYRERYESKDSLGTNLD